MALRCPHGLLQCEEHAHDLVENWRLIVKQDGTVGVRFEKPEAKEPAVVPSVPRGFTRRDKNGFPVFGERTTPRPQTACEALGARPRSVLHEHTR